MIDSGISPDDPHLRDAAADKMEGIQQKVGEIRAGKLAGRSMWAAIWILAMPVLLQQMMQACVGMADKIFAGRLPSEIVRPGLDAIGIGSYIGWFIGIAMAGLGIGGQAIIARAMGAGNEDEAHDALGEAMMLSLIWGVFVGVLLWFSVAPLAAMTG
jgi:Na+-driven multidrug efflux pump